MLQCHATAVAPDCRMLVMCQNLEDYKRAYNDFLFERPCAGQVSKYLFVRTAKNEVILPV